MMTKSVSGEYPWGGPIQRVDAAGEEEMGKF